MFSERSRVREGLRSLQLCPRQISQLTPGPHPILSWTHPRASWSAEGTWLYGFQETLGFEFFQCSLGLGGEVTGVIPRACHWLPVDTRSQFIATATITDKDIQAIAHLSTSFPLFSLTHGFKETTT